MRMTLSTKGFLHTILLCPNKIFDRWWYFWWRYLKNGVQNFPHLYYTFLICLNLFLISEVGASRGNFSFSLSCKFNFFYEKFIGKCSIRSIFLTSHESFLLYWLFQCKEQIIHFFGSSIKNTTSLTKGMVDYDYDSVQVDLCTRKLWFSSCSLFINELGTLFLVGEFRRNISILFLGSPVNVKKFNILY